MKIRVAVVSVVSIVLLGVAGIARTSAIQGAPADLVLVNARVLTVDQRFSVAEGFAIGGGRFVAVGSSDEMRRLAGPATRVIDGRGRTVLPGIIDTHVHALDVAAGEAVQPFVNLTSIPQLQEWVRAETAKRPDGTWIWTPRAYPTRLREHRFPTREELDAVAPSHPVVVDSAYAFSLNSAALKAAGITRDTPNPPGGAIVRDAAGDATGLLRNARDMLARFRNKTGAAPLDQLERVHQQYLAAGLTSVIERGATLDGYQSYRALQTAGRLKVRTTITLRVPNAADAAAVERFVEGLPFRFGEGNEMLKAGPLKLVVDGGILIGTSFMRQPYGAGARQLYAIEDPQDRGFLTLTPDQVASAVAVIHKRGWQMVAHVTGDAGVDVVLDAIEAAQKGAPSADRRHTLIHAYFVSPETAARAARLGVLVDTQPAWHYKDADALALGLGRPRLEPFIGLRTWRQAGAEVSINTDHMLGLDRNGAMNPFNPFLTIYSATTRKTESGQTIGPDEAISREEALRMMTSTAARFSFDEKDRGSIEKGKLGDFIILDDHFLTVPAERLRTLAVDTTAIGGRIVYERGDGSR